MTETKTLRKSYVSRLLVIDKSNIEDFELLPNHRHLRNAQVGRIYQALKKGKHFESQIVVNQKGRKMQLIDGGHRISAIAGFLKEFPDKQIEVNMAVYDNLDEEGIKEVFSIWNKGIKQSPEDYINLRKNEIPIWKLLSNSFPCKVSIYSQKGDFIKFKTLLGAYMGAVYLNEPNSYDGNIDIFIKKSKELGHKDYKFLSRFIEGFGSVFGNPSNTNPFSSYVIFNALMRVYYDNNVWQGESYFWNKVRSSIYKSSIIMKYSLSGYARLMIRPCVDEMLILLNKGKRSNYFVLRQKEKSNAVVKEKVRKEEERGFGVVELKAMAKEL